jgi:hypothetical protein
MKQEMRGGEARGTGHVIQRADIYHRADYQTAHEALSEQNVNVNFVLCMNLMFSTP